MTVPSGKKGGSEVVVVLGDEAGFEVRTEQLLHLCAGVEVLIQPVNGVRHCCLGCPGMMKEAESSRSPPLTVQCSLLTGHWPLHWLYSRCRSKWRVAASVAARPRQLEVRWGAPRYISRTRGGEADRVMPRVALRGYPLQCTMLRYIPCSLLCSHILLMEVDMSCEVLRPLCC